MKSRITCIAGGLIAMSLLAAPATADIVITQTGASAPTYGTTLNFDEVGGPTGVVPADGWLASHGITSLVTGVGDAQIAVGSDLLPWLPASNVLYAPFGAFMNFSEDLTEFSAQVWDSSGPPSPFGGGMGIFLFNDGEEVASSFFNPAWGGVGDSWFDITTTDGSVFDEIRILGFGFPADTIMDNASWNTVPGPGALALLSVAGLVSGRRRRA